MQPCQRFHGRFGGAARKDQFRGWQCLPDAGQDVAGKPLNGIDVWLVSKMADEENDRKSVGGGGLGRQVKGNVLETRNAVRNDIDRHLGPESAASRSRSCFEQTQTLSTMASAFLSRRLMPTAAATMADLDRMPSALCNCPDRSDSTLCMSRMSCLASGRRGRSNLNSPMPSTTIVSGRKVRTSASRRDSAGRGIRFSALVLHHPSDLARGSPSIVKAAVWMLAASAGGRSACARTETRQTGPKAAADTALRWFRRSAPEEGWKAGSWHSTSVRRSLREGSSNLLTALKAWESHMVTVVVAWTQSKTGRKPRAERPPSEALAAVPHSTRRLPLGELAVCESHPPLNPAFCRPRRICGLERIRFQIRRARSSRSSSDRGGSMPGK